VLYWSEYGAGRVRSVSLTAGSFVILEAGNGGAVFNGDGGRATSTTLLSPAGVYCDTLGLLYVTETVGQYVRKVTSGVISVVTGTGSISVSPLSVGDGGNPTAASVNSPLLHFVDILGQVSFADLGNNRIRNLFDFHMASDLVLITTAAGNGNTGYNGDNQNALLANVFYPACVVTQTDGVMYISEFFGQRIRRVDINNIITTIAGNGIESGDLGDGGRATSATLNKVFQIALDTANNLYLADFNNHKIRAVSLTLGTIKLVAGTGGTVYNGDNMRATSAVVNNPAGVFLDSRGHVFISENFQNRIRRVDAVSQIITTQVGLIHCLLLFFTF
jgi:hypothetical protein